MNKRFLLLFSALVIAGGFWGYKLFFAKSDDIVLNGNVEVQDVNLAFRVAGRVDTINVDEGAQVKCGDLLATLDKDIFKAKVKYAKAQVDGAAVSLSNAKKDFKRNTDLLRKHSISEKVYDAAKTEYEVALSKMDSAKAMCEYMEIDLNDADLISPVDGVVLTRNIERGEMVSAGTVVFSIMPNNQTKVKTFASEDVLSRINHGDVVYVNIETMPEKKFVGHIGFISSEAEFTPKNIETKELRTSLMYRIRVIIDEPAPELKQGMPVTVSYTK